MTRSDVKYYADCLKRNFKIDSNTMEMFCNEVVDSQHKLQKIENIIKDSEDIGFTVTKDYFFEKIVEVMKND